jgi:hypothetical protein
MTTEPLPTLYEEIDVLVIRPDAILLEGGRKGLKQLWAVVQTKGLFDEEDLYLVSIPADKANQIREIVYPKQPDSQEAATIPEGKDAVVLLNLYGTAPSHPLRITDNDALNLEQRLKILDTMPTKDLLELLDFLIRSDSRNQPFLNPDTLTKLSGVYEPASAALKETAVVVGKGINRTDTTVNEKVGEEIILTKDATIIRGPFSQLQLDKGIDIQAQSQSTTAVDDKKMVNENTISHFLPETLVTWPGSMKWLPALDMIINIGWKLANFLMIIRTTMSLVKQSNNN